MPAFRFLTQSVSDLVKNLNASVRRPSKVPLIAGPRTPALNLLPTRWPQIRWRRTERDEFSFLTSDTDVKEKKADLPPSDLRHHICGDPEGNNFKAGVRRPSIRGSFDRRRTPAFRFLTRSLADWVKNLNTGVRCPLKLSLIDRPRTPVNCCLPDHRKYDGGERKRANLFFFS